MRSFGTIGKLNVLEFPTANGIEKEQQDLQLQMQQMQKNKQNLEDLRQIFASLSTECKPATQAVVHPIETEALTKRNISTDQKQQQPPDSLSFFDKLEQLNSSTQAHIQKVLFNSREIDQRYLRFEQEEKTPLVQESIYRMGSNESLLPNTYYDSRDKSNSEAPHVEEKPVVTTRKHKRLNKKLTINTATKYNSSTQTRKADSRADILQKIKKENCVSPKQFNQILRGGSPVSRVKSYVVKKRPNPRNSGKVCNVQVKVDKKKASSAGQIGRTLSFSDVAVRTNDIAMDTINNVGTRASCPVHLIQNPVTIDTKAVKSKVFDGLELEKQKRKRKSVLRPPISWVSQSIDHIT